MRSDLGEDGQALALGAHLRCEEQWYFQRSR
jgi:hypothetical protein